MTENNGPYHITWKDKLEIEKLAGKHATTVSNLLSIPKKAVEEYRASPEYWNREAIKKEEWTQEHQVLGQVTLAIQSSISTSAIECGDTLKQVYNEFCSTLRSDAGKRKRTDEVEVSAIPTVIDSTTTADLVPPLTPTTIRKAPLKPSPVYVHQRPQVRKKDLSLEEAVVLVSPVLNVIAGNRSLPFKRPSLSGPSHCSPKIGLHWVINGNIESRLDGIRFLTKNNRIGCIRSSQPFSTTFNYFHVQVESLSKNGKLLIGAMDVESRKMIFVANDGSFWRNGSLVEYLSEPLSSNGISVARGDGCVIFEVNNNNYSISLQNGSYTPFIIIVGEDSDLLTQLNPYLVDIEAHPNNEPEKTARRLNFGDADENTLSHNEVPPPSGTLNMRQSHMSSPDEPLARGPIELKCDCGYSHNRTHKFCGQCGANLRSLKGQNDLDVNLSNPIEHDNKLRQQYATEDTVGESEYCNELEKYCGNGLTTEKSVDKASQDCDC